MILLHSELKTIMLTKEEALKKIKLLVEKFDEQKESYKRTEYNETKTRQDFINPFWKALGWDMDNERGYAESYREVAHEDRIKVGGTTKAPDYTFKIMGGKKLFFLEAKRPSVDVKTNAHAALQVRRYGWNAKLAISIISDFEEFAVYDCRQKPNQSDSAGTARIKYYTYSDYITEFDYFWNTFSRECVLKGNLDKYIESDKDKKGTTTVDQDFLASLDKWREKLASNIAARNSKKGITEEELTFVVQNIINRIIFLRIAEDRGAEEYGDLNKVIESGDYYKNLIDRFYLADKKYNSGLFDFNKDTISPQLNVDKGVVREIILELYYPHCPYEFSVLPIEVLGNAYEHFLGKQIQLSKSNRAIIEEKPEVRKAGGVYYTPQYIVEYIVKNTVGKLVENKTPKEVNKIKIVDPACGSGSFLIGAYQYLLNWHKDFYTKSEKQSKGEKANPLTPLGELTTAEKKRILLNNIYGVDLDGNAVEVTKLSLLLKCMEGETFESIETEIKLNHHRILPTLDNNIKTGNSLIDLDYFDKELDNDEEKEVKPFSWEKNFPKVFERDVAFDEKANLIKQHNQRVKQLEEDGKKLVETLMASESPIEYHTRNRGFDVVIGNPPYVKVADKHLVNYFSSKYEHQDYQQDLYLLFLERYKKILAKGGKLGVIIPNTWLQSIKFRNIRRYLMNNFLWERILHINQHIFKAVVDTHVIIFERNSYVKNGEITIDIYDKNEIRLHQHISQLKLPDSGEVINVLANDDEKALFEKIKNASIPIYELCEVYNGAKPFSKGRGKPQQTEETMRLKPYVKVNVMKPEGENWLPLMRGSLMNKYVNFWDKNSWIQYGEWLAEPRKPEIFEAKEKIIVRQTSDSIIATIIGANIICRDNLHLILSEKINLHFILGLLNSKLTDFYYYQINPERGEVLAQVKKQHIEQLPIPATVSEKQQSEIIKHVDQLLQLNKEFQTATLPNQKEQIQAKIGYCEDKINEIIYELYGLTEDEITIVEK